MGATWKQMINMGMWKFLYYYSIFATSLKNCIKIKSFLNNSDSRT